MLFELGLSEGASEHNFRSNVSLLRCSEINLFFAIGTIHFDLRPISELPKSLKLR